MPTDPAVEMIVDAALSDRNVLRGVLASVRSQYILANKIVIQTVEHTLKTPLITTQRHYTRPRVRENSGCWSSSRVNASISGCNQRSGIVGIRS